MRKYVRSFWKSYGVRLSLYSLAIVSIPPPLATAIKHDWLPTSNPTTDISYITFGKRIQLVFQVIHKLLPSTCQYLTFLSNMADKEEKFWEAECSASTRKKTSPSQWLKISFFPISCLYDPVNRDSMKCEMPSSDWNTRSELHNFITIMTIIVLTELGVRFKVI